MYGNLEGFSAYTYKISMADFIGLGESISFFLLETSWNISQG